jgi:putative transcriptional regulator
MSGDSAPTNLTNHFLIAMPGMEDAFFAKSVVYLVDHNDQGAMGLMINKAVDISMEALFVKIDLSMPRTDLADSPVLQGGPVHQDRGFVLHDPVFGSSEPEQASPYQSTIRVPGGLDMTTSRDVLESISTGGGPKRVLVSLGYAAWGEGQLESELKENAWLTVEADASLIFDAPMAQRYDRALGLLGLQARMISTQAGNA